MPSLLCVTGNTDKFNTGRTWFNEFGVTLEQVVTDIDEIQGEDPELIIRDKAAKAFEATGKPVVVTDDSWSIPGLNGFPGPYMKSMNHWFTVDDFLRLTKDLKDRSIILHQFVAYQDEYECVVFSKDIPGTMLTEARGESGPAIKQIMVFDIDYGKTMSELEDSKTANDPVRLKKRGDSWEDLARWYSKKIAV